MLIEVKNLFRDKIKKDDEENNSPENRNFISLANFFDFCVPINISPSGNKYISSWEKLFRQ
jgi:hypothetical protein